jgi:hypothetical protein
MEAILHASFRGDGPNHFPLAFFCFLFLVPGTPLSSLQTSFIPQFFHFHSHQQDYNLSNLLCQHYRTCKTCHCVRKQISHRPGFGQDEDCHAQNNVLTRHVRSHFGSSQLLGVEVCRVITGSCIILVFAASADRSKIFSAYSGAK